MNVGTARIIGDQVKCWHCPGTLGQIVDRLEEPRILAAQSFYRRAATVPPAITAAGIRDVLVIPRRVRERLARTGLHWTRPKTLDKDGAAPIAPSTICRLPALVPCHACGEPNRVILTSS